MRLLNAGLDKKSADMHWKASAYERNEDGQWVPQESGAHVYINIGAPKNELEFPAWSMGRLWQILNENGVWFYEYATCDQAEKVLESLVNAVEWAVKGGSIKRKEHDEE